MNNRILSDSEHAYMHVHDCLTELCSEFTGADSGRPLTVSELLEFIKLVINDLPDGSLSDLTGKEVVGLSFKLKKRRKITPAVGGVVAVPLPRNMFCLAVYLGRNSRGPAYGFLYPFVATPNDLLKDQFRPLFSAYIISERVETGEWRIVAGADRALGIEFFNQLPDFYYEKLDQPGYEEIGAFGSAESPDGKLRHLSKDEAELVGLYDDSYHQVFFPTQLIQYIERRARIVGLQEGQE